MNKYYIKYFIYLLLSLVVTFIGAISSPMLSSTKNTILIIASIGLIFLFVFSEGIFKKIMLFIFNFAEGMIIAQLILKNSKIDINIILSTIGITILITTIFIVIGIISKDLSGMKNFLFTALIILFIVSIVSMFVYIPFLSYLIIILFCGYVAYDFNKFKNLVNKKRVISDDIILDHVMDMYLDIVNLFVQILASLSDD